MHTYLGAYIPIYHTYLHKYRGCFFFGIIYIPIYIICFTYLRAYLPIMYGSLLYWLLNYLH
jgi:hypothetical protein